MAARSAVREEVEPLDMTSLAPREPPQARTAKSGRCNELNPAQEVPPLPAADSKQFRRYHWSSGRLSAPGRVEDTASLPARFHSARLGVGIPYLETDLSSTRYLPDTHTSLKRAVSLYCGTGQARGPEGQGSPAPPYRSRAPEVGEQGIEVSRQKT